MTENKPAMAPDLPDEDLPDLTSTDWQAKFAKAKVKRGRPKADNTKISTTIRLDPDVLEAFKADGPGWQRRINEALRRVAGLD